MISFLRFTYPRRPFSDVRGNQIGLRFQDHSIVQDAQCVGLQSRTCRGDIDDQVRCPAAGVPSVAPRLSTIR